MVGSSYAPAIYGTRGSLQMPTNTCIELKYELAQKVGTAKNKFSVATCCFGHKTKASSMVGMVS